VDFSLPTAVFVVNGPCQRNMIMTGERIHPKYVVVWYWLLESAVS